MVFMGPLGGALGPLVLDDQQTTPPGPYTNPMNTEPRFLGPPEFFVWGEHKIENKPQQYAKMGRAPMGGPQWSAFVTGGL